MSTGISTPADFNEVRDTFTLSLGGLQEVAFRDPTEFTTNGTDPSQPILYPPHATDEYIGLGDGKTTTFNLVRTSSNVSYPVLYPVEGTVSVSVSGVVLNSGWSVDYTTGTLTFSTAPAANAQICWGGEFYTRARFSGGSITFSYSDAMNGSASIELIEVL